MRRNERGRKMAAALALAGLGGAAWLGCVGGAMAQTAVGTTVAETAVAKAPKPLVSWSGSDSKIAARRYVRVDTREQWLKLWHEHMGKTPPKTFASYRPQTFAPQVDFNTCMVVAVFGGKHWNSAGIFAASIIETKDAITLRFDDFSYQTGDWADEVTTFGIFVLPRSSKTIVLEEDVQNRRAAPPLWKERARL